MKCIPSWLVVGQFAQDCTALKNYHLHESRVSINTLNKVAHDVVRVVTLSRLVSNHQVRWDLLSCERLTFVSFALVSNT